MTNFNKASFSVRQGQTKEAREGAVRTFGDREANRYCPTCERRYDPDKECKDAWHAEHEKQASDGK